MIFLSQRNHKYDDTWPFIVDWLLLYVQSVISVKELRAFSPSNLLSICTSVSFYFRLFHHNKKMFIFSFGMMKYRFSFPSVFGSHSWSLFMSYMRVSYLFSMTTCHCIILHFIQWPICVPEGSRNFRLFQSHKKREKVCCFLCFGSFWELNNLLNDNSLILLSYTYLW